MYTRIRVTPCLSVRFKIQQTSLERKRCSTTLITLIICPTVPPRLPEVMDFTRCNRADINCYVRMPNIHLCLTLMMKCSLSYVKKVPHGNQTSPRETVAFNIEMGRYLCWNRSNTMLVSQIQNAAG